MTSGDLSFIIPRCRHGWLRVLSLLTVDTQALIVPFSDVYRRGTKQSYLPLYTVADTTINLLTAGAAYIWFFIFY